MSVEKSFAITLLIAGTVIVGLNGQWEGALGGLMFGVGFIIFILD